MPVREDWVILDGVTYPFRLLSRDRQKNIYIRVTTAGQIVLSAPQRVSLDQARAILSARSEWLLGHIRIITAGLDELDTAKQVWFCGQKLTVAIGTGVRRHVTADPERGVLTLSGVKPGGEALEQIERWLRAQAGEILPARAREISNELGIPFRTLFLRNQHTRWGSSSSRGNISLNWRIVMAPPEVQRYLIVHELVHQLHPDHSRAFWEDVARFCPEYRKHSRWLKRHAALNGLFRQ